MGPTCEVYFLLNKNATLIELDNINSRSNNVRTSIIKLTTQKHLKMYLYQNIDPNNNNNNNKRKTLKPKIFS